MVSSGKNLSLKKKKPIKVDKANCTYLANYQKQRAENGDPIDTEKFLLMKAGCELCILSKEDIEYMSDNNISVICAENRLITRRLANY